MKGTWIKKPIDDITIIFIHGILSSDASCWTHANGIYWPKLLAEEPTCKQFGIYSFEYKTGFFSGSFDLNDVVESFREQLDLDEVSNYGTLIFVCHSMGGIVARKYIVKNAAKLERESKRIGLFLIASPAIGSIYANWISPFAKLFNNAQARILRSADDNKWLRELDRDFINIKDEGHIEVEGKELIEDVCITVPRFLVMKQIVNPISAARYFKNAVKIPNSDHFSIAKVENKDDTKHRLLLSFLDKYIEGVVSTQEALIKNSEVVIQFKDDLYADIVSCQLSLDEIASGDYSIKIKWPDSTLKFESQLRYILDEITKYLDNNSIFFGSNPKDIADMASSIKTTLNSIHEMKEGAELRAPKLVRGMVPYWSLGFDNIIAESLANFITLINSDIIYQIIYFFRHKNIYEEYFPMKYESWFDSYHFTDRYRQIFSIEEELCYMRAWAVSGEKIEMRTPYWGPRSEVMYTATRKATDAIHGSWFYRYLIPQIERDLIFNSSSSGKVFRYDERVDVIKVTDLNEYKIYYENEFYYYL